jgi:hypothetical protein
MEADGYQLARFIPEVYDHVIPYATRPDVRQTLIKSCIWRTRIARGSCSLPPRKTWSVPVFDCSLEH